MDKINFAYDDIVGEQLTWRWHINDYDQRFYPINGVFEECYYDYHAPLQTVFEKNNISTNTITVREAIETKKKFIYVLTFRYLLNTILNNPNYNIFSHLPVGLIKAVQNNKCVLILNDAHESAYYTDAFYKQLAINLENADIDPKKIVLITGNPSNDISKTDLNLIFWQYFETASRLSFENIQIVNKDRFNTNELKKFLCLNRVPREIRYFFMYEMYKRNLMSDFRASLDRVNSMNDIVSYNNNLFIDNIDNLDKFNEMLSKLPWIVDNRNFKVNHWNTIDKRFSYENLIFVTTETLFKSDMNNLFLTEKTFKPIGLKMPFIILGQPKTLTHLHNIGYKTFNSMWDESYDDVFDPLERMYKICDLVESLSKLSLSSLKEIVINSFDIFDHNHHVLMTKRPESNLIERIKEKYESCDDRMW